MSLKRLGVIAGVTAGVIALQGCAQFEGRTLLLLDLGKDSSLTATVTSLEVSVVEQTVADWSSVPVTAVFTSSLPTKEGIYFDRGTGGLRKVRVVAKGTSGPVGQATGNVTLKEGDSVVLKLTVIGSGSGAGCDAARQTGCSAGQHCVWDCSARAGNCVANGTKPAGDTCTAPSDCAAGMTCQDGICQRYCLSDADCPSDTAGYCVGPQPCPTSASTPPSLCLPSCDPYLQNCQPIGEASLPGRCDLYCDGGAQYRCGSVLEIAGFGMDGETCVDQKDCYPGYACAQGTCRAYCKSSSDCPDDYSCSGPAAPTCGAAGGNKVCVPGSGSCDPVLQTGCSSNAKCVYDCNLGATTCVPYGSKQTGQACTSQSDCDIGLGCVLGTCQRYCNNDGDCTSADTAGYCAFWLTCGSTVTTYSVCMTACDPADSKNETDYGCGAGFRCDVYCDGGQPYRCSAAGSGGGALGATCTAQTDCKPGFACVRASASAAATCQQYCSSPGDCPGSLPYCKANSGPICNAGETSSSMLCSSS